MLLLFPRNLSRTSLCRRTKVLLAVPEVISLPERSIRSGNESHDSFHACASVDFSCRWRTANRNFAFAFVWLIESSQICMEKPHECEWVTVERNLRLKMRQISPEKNGQWQLISGHEKAGRTHHSITKTKKNYAQLLLLVLNIHHIPTQWRYNLHFGGNLWRNLSEIIFEAISSESWVSHLLKLYLYYIYKRMSIYNINECIYIFICIILSNNFLLVFYLIPYLEKQI